MSITLKASSAAEAAVAQASQPAGGSGGCGAEPNETKPHRLHLPTCLRSLPRWLRRLGTSVTALLILAAVGWALLPAPPPLEGVSVSPMVFDRTGQPLRLGLSADDKFRVHLPLRSISPEMIRATLAQEDQYFWFHPGLNPIASLRALAHLCLGHTGRGGASTITMQVARLRYGLHTRTARGKLFQMWRALEIERHYTKTQILETYLNLAPYGRNIEGVGAAGFLYFGKSPARLGRTEAAYLSVLPQSPTRRTPRTAAPNASLLGAAQRLEKRLAKGERPALPSPPAFRAQSGQRDLAPHFVTRALRTHPGEPRIATTLDPALQGLLERRLASYVTGQHRLGVRNAAALLLDTRSMEVLAQVGSADFADDQIAGQVDGTRSRRSPGSALKPFIYALAMDAGLIHPQSMLADAPRRFGSYAPENFDGTFAGPLKACDALTRSRNVPAVALAEQLTHPTLYGFLRRGGVALPHEESFYGLTLPLGGGEVTMEEIVRLYAVLANGGRLRPLRRLLPKPDETAALPGPRLLSPEAAFLTLEMLGHSPRPDLAREAGEEGVYWKTGTSMGFRDAWSVAVFDHFVLAVWVGNFDGRPNPAFIGRTCAGPLLFQIVDSMRLEGLAHPRPLRPPSGANLRAVELCAVSGQLPSAACTHRCQGWFIPGISPITACEVHREILLDAATGLRLPADDGEHEVRREIYEFWPSHLLTLFEQAGLPRRRPPPFAPGFGVEASARIGRAPHIVSPAQGRTYALPPGNSAQSTITLQAQTEGDVARLYWFAGTTFLGASTPRQPLTWHPAPGEYRLTALDDQGRSGFSTVTLQAAGAE